MENLQALGMVEKYAVYYKRKLHSTFYYAVDFVCMCIGIEFQYPQTIARAESVFL